MVRVRGMQNVRIQYQLCNDSSGHQVYIFVIMHVNKEELLHSASFDPHCQQLCFQCLQM